MKQFSIDAVMTYENDSEMYLLRCEVASSSPSICWYSFDLRCTHLMKKKMMPPKASIDPITRKGASKLPPVPSMISPAIAKVEISIIPPL